MDSIQWKQPPPDPREAGQRRKSRWQGTVDALRSKPGEWALVQTGVAASQVQVIQKAKMPVFAPAGSFEATSRRNGDTYDIYARYVGESA